jgi:chromosome segregation ATPase
MLENQRLKDSIEELNKNSETLQWELTKSRAQMTSFERACENYQLQLKEALERIGTSDDGQGKLSDMNKHLQSTVEEAQKQNEEFLKREKLFESELEKNRIQIAALERDCEHLKADVNKGQ